VALVSANPTAVALRRLTSLQKRWAVPSEASPEDEMDIAAGKSYCW